MSVSSYLRSVANEKIFVDVADAAGLDADDAHIVVFDFDSIIFPLVTAVSKVPGYEYMAATVEGFEDGQTPLDYDAMHTWDHMLHGCGGLQEMLAAFEVAMEYDHMHSVGIIEGAAQAFNDIKTAGAKIVVMTDRPYKFAQGTYQFLRDHGMEPDAFMLGTFDKVAVAKEIGARLMIDDKPATLEAAAQAGMPIVTLSYRYNGEVIDAHDIPSAETWQQLMELHIPMHIELQAPQLGSGAPEANVQAAGDEGLSLQR